MNRSTFNHGKSGDTNPKGRSRSPLLKLYPRLLRSEREEIIGHRASAACGGRPRLCYTLDEGKETERETTNCPPKRVRSRVRERGRGMGWIPQEPGRSGIDQFRNSRGCRGCKRGRACAEISAAWERTGRGEVGAGERINKRTRGRHRKS